MLSMREMFYGASEPIWILKPESKEENKKGGQGQSGPTKQLAEKDKDFSILSTIPYYPYYYPDYVAPPQPKQAVEKEKKPAASASTAPTYYPYYYPEYAVRPVAPAYPASKPDPKKEAEKKKEEKVVLKVPICCEECAETVYVALYALKGVKSVECDTRKERVTVIVTTAAPADVLLECRRLFKKSRMWSDDD